VDSTLLDAWLADAEGVPTVEHGAVGNVTTRVEGHQRVRTFAGTSSMLGPRGLVRRPSVESGPLEHGEALLLFTDGISSRATLGGELLRQHPIVLAQHVLAGFGRSTDDALVLVVR
jgi:serine/threonine protein phosphatase PrpC